MVSESKPLFSGDPFGRLLALLIALVTIFAAIVAYLEADAGARSDDALRDAQQLAIQAVGVKTRGEQLASYALSDAYRLWLELDTQGFLAEQQGDAERANHYRQVRDQMQTLTPLLSAPYFDPATAELPNVKAFEAENYIIEATALSERFASASEISDAWAGKANTYVTHLTLLTVALFLYGLSLTISGRMKWLFVGVGTFIGFITLIWMFLVLFESIPTLSDEAVIAYADGVGLAHQDDHEAALSAFNSALEQNPDYANAYYERAKLYFKQANFELAAADYEAALEAGREDVNVPWNLGWTYYRMGNLPQAIEATSAALELAPEQIALHFNLGLAQLVSGDVAQAEKVYSNAATLAAQQVANAREAGEEPSATLWWYLGASAQDLTHLLDCLTEQLCDDALPYSTIVNPEAAQNAATALNQQVKTLTTALEYTSQLPPASVAAKIDSFEVAQATYDDNGQIVAYAPLETEVVGPIRGAGVFEDEGELDNVDLTRSDSANNGDMFILFDYADMQDGQLVVVKVYFDGRESPGLRLVEEWALGNQGQANLLLSPGGTFALQPGDYDLEIYVDSHLVQQGSFIIPE